MTLEGQPRQDQRDGKGSQVDNLFTERLWHGVKCQGMYFKGYRDGSEARAALADYFRLHNTQRSHQGLGRRTPVAEYNSGGNDEAAVGQTANNDPREIAGLDPNPVSITCRRQGLP